MAAVAQLKNESAAVDPCDRLGNLPTSLSVEIPVPNFSVADLMKIARGQLINTRWTVGEDVPLRVNGQLIAWSEFEIVNNHVAVRLTELA
jgi:flagellar motor switch protein FliN